MPRNYDTRNPKILKPYPPYGQMVKGYKYTGPITFNLQYGHLASGQFPADCIAACSGQGSVDDAVEFWVKKLNFQVPLELAVRYLEEFGAWDTEELADNDANARRVLWSACCEIREQGGWSGLCR